MEEANNLLLLQAVLCIFSSILINSNASDIKNFQNKSYHYLKGNFCDSIEKGMINFNSNTENIDSIIMNLILSDNYEDILKMKIY